MIIISESARNIENAFPGFVLIHSMKIFFLFKITSGQQFCKGNIVGENVEEIPVPLGNEFKDISYNSTNFI